MKQQILKRVVLVSTLVLPISVYLLFVYGLKDVFFQTLTIVGPRSVEKVVDKHGETSFDTSYYQVPYFSMVNQNKKQVSSEDLVGKYYVASFFFASCPSICPAMNFKLKQISDRFKAYEEFYMISFTVDPKRDTTEVLKKYAKDLHVDDRNWYFLTGEEYLTHELASGYLLGASVDTNAPGGYYHAEGVVIVDWNGNIRSRKDDNGNVIGSYDVSTVTGLNTLEEDLKVMKAEYERWKHNEEERK